MTSDRITRRSPKSPGTTIQSAKRGRDVRPLRAGVHAFEQVGLREGQVHPRLQVLNQSWLVASSPVRLGTSRTSTKYMTSPPAELRSSIPSMVPIDIETRLPSTIVRAWPTERSQTVERAGDGAADDVADRADREGEQHGRDGDDHAETSWRRPPGAGWRRR